jgi:hypothetical protein
MVGMFPEIILLLVTGNARLPAYVIRALCGFNRFRILFGFHKSFLRRSKNKNKKEYDKQ